MSRAAATFVFVSLATALAISGCSSGDIAVGSSQQALRTNKNGTPTGNGSTCSWDDSVSNDGSTTPANGGHNVGDTFTAPDGCNNCTCTAQGIACTLRDCAPVGGGCTEEAKQCPDGSSVGRTGPNCAFAECPPLKPCPADAMKCPDGSTATRTGPNCAFTPCPTPAVCPTDAKQCPNGGFVSRTGPNCTFPACP